jgi:signal transduction histidine kinase
MISNEPIFIVEDEALIAHDIQRSLESIGYMNIRIFPSGEQLLDHIKTELPALILMDIILKGKLDGIETAELINRKYDIPVIYVTAQTDKSTYERAKNSRPYGFITKPLRNIDLFSSVDIAIDRHRGRIQLRKLARRADEIRERERTKIAREIHDDLGQSLTALKLDITYIQRKYPLKDEYLEEKFNGMTELVSNLLDTVRTLTGELRPRMIDELGLIEAMRSLCGKSEKRSGIRFIFTDSQTVTDIDRKITRFELISIYRIFQEAITNVMRHSQGSECRVTLDYGGNVFQMAVFDDGVGIPENRIYASDSYGLQGIRERAASFGWDIVLDSIENKGTGLILTVPVMVYDELDT